MYILLRMGLNHQLKITSKIKPPLLLQHRSQTIELVGLEGGHFYDVWIEACIADHCKKSKSLVKEIECEHKCSDGTCVHWNAKCNYIRCRPCPFIQIFWSYHPYFILILSRFYPNIWKNLDKIWINLEKTLYPDFIQIF